MPRAFDITPSSSRVKMNSGETGEVSFTVSNKLPRSIRTRALARPEGETDPSWLAIPPEGAEPELAADETRLITVKVRLPPTLKDGTYPFHIVVSSLAEPDEIYAESASVPIEVKHVDRPFPWWIVYLAAGVVVVAGASFGVAKLVQGSRGLPGANCASDMNCSSKERCVEFQPGVKACLLKPEEKCTGDIQCASGFCRRDDHLCSRDDGKCTAATAARDCRPGAFTCVGDRCLLLVGQRCGSGPECSTNICLNSVCVPCQAACFPPNFCQGNLCLGGIFQFPNKSVEQMRRFQGIPGVPQ